MNNKLLVIWNIIALILYFFQDWADWSWPWLENAQKVLVFKQTTAVILLCYLIFQNALSFVRLNPDWGSYQKKIYSLHFQTSPLSIPLLYLHSAKMGYHYTFLFSLSYCANVLIGSLAPKPLNIKNKRYRFYWMVVHVALSTFITLFVFFHIFMTFYFN